MVAVSPYFSTREPKVSEHLPWVIELLRAYEEETGTQIGCD